MGPAPRRPADGPINLSHISYKLFTHTESNTGSHLLYVPLKNPPRVYFLNFLRAARGIRSIASVR